MPPSSAWASPSCPFAPRSAATYAVYRASTLRRHPECAYGTQGGCEHTPLSDCLFAAGAALWIVPHLRVDWEGCSGPLRDVDPGNYGRTGDPE